MKRTLTLLGLSLMMSAPLALAQNPMDQANEKAVKITQGPNITNISGNSATINWTTVAPAFEKPLAETGKKLKVIPWSQFGYDGYGLSVFVSDKMLAERKDTVTKFLRAYARATELAIADPKAAAAALKTMVPEIDEAVAQAQFVASVPLMVNEIAKANGAGTFQKALLAKTWEWTAKAQNMPLDKLDPETAVDRSLLP